MSKLVYQRPFEDKGLRKALQDCGFANGDISMLLRMNETAARWRAALGGYGYARRIPSQSAVNVREAWSIASVNRRMALELFLLRKGSPIAASGQGSPLRGERFTLNKCPKPLAAPTSATVEIDRCRPRLDCRRSHLPIPNGRDRPSPNRRDHQPSP